MGHVSQGAAVHTENQQTGGPNTVRLTSRLLLLHCCVQTISCILSKAVPSSRLSPLDSLSFTGELYLAHCLFLSIATPVPVHSLLGPISSSLGLVVP